MFSKNFLNTPATGGLLSTDWIKETNAAKGQTGLCLSAIQETGIYCNFTLIVKTHLVFYTSKRGHTMCVFVCECSAFAYFPARMLVMMPL